MFKKIEFPIGSISIIILLVCIVSLVIKFYDEINLAITRYKWQKVYFMLLNSYYSSLTENGKFSSDMSSQEVLNRIIKNLPVKKICNYSIKEGCWSKISYSYDNKFAFSDPYSPGFELKNGVTFSHIKPTYSECSKRGFCTSLSFDLNGLEEPNTFGKDQFRIYYYQDKVVPYSPVEDSVAGPLAKFFLHVR